MQCVILDHNVPSALVLNLRQIPLSYVSPGKHAFSSKGSKNVSIKGLDDKRQITETFIVSATGFFLPIQLIYRSKSKRFLPKFTFLSNFHITFSSKIVGLIWKSVKYIQSNYLSKKGHYLSPNKKGLNYPEYQRSLIIMDTFKGQDNKEMKRLCAKNNRELVIVPQNLTNKSQSLDIRINQSVNKIISNKFSVCYADRASK